MIYPSTNWMRLASRVLLICMLVALASLFVQPAQAATTDTRVLPQLQNDAAANPKKTFRVIIQRINGNRNADGAVTTAGGTKVRDMRSDTFVANVPAAKIANLGKHAAIKFINYDAPVRKMGTVDPFKLANLFTGTTATANYPGTMGAPGLWSTYTGAGVGVAVVDTGINTARDWNDIAGKSRIAASVKFSSTTNSAIDGHGHGSHVAGIIGGNSWQSNTTAVQGKYIGIAPEANLINVKVSDDQGISYVSDVVDAIEWVIANRVTYNIRVMNLSLVSSVAESYTTSYLAAAVEKAWFNGIFVVVAAGNSGPDTMYYPPANDPFVVTVGAADPKGTTNPLDDGMAPWSSYGTTQDGVSKPDVVAPGRYMTSVLASNNSTLAQNYPSRIVDGGYIWMSGTSMAAPVVSGIAALAFQAHPGWTNDQLKWLLLNTSYRLGGTTPLPGQGAGEVSGSAVLGYSLTPSYANQNLTVSSQLVTTDGSTTYSSANWSSANWSSANWSSANWSSANWSSANWSSANWSTSNWASAAESSVQ